MPSEERTVERFMRFARFTHTSAGQFHKNRTKKREKGLRTALRRLLHPCALVVSSTPTCMGSGRRAIIMAYDEKKKIMVEFFN